MQTTRLGLKLLSRDWRAGELRILVLAIVIAVTAVCSINFYTNRIARGLNQQAASLLGADLIVISPDIIPAEWQQLARQLQLTSTIIVQYPTVVTAAEQLQLVNLKAITANYPLRGHLQISTDPNGSGQITNTIPATGTIWAEPRLLDLLNVKPGATVTIGVATFKIAQLLTLSPQTSAFNIAPGVLMNAADVNKTQTLLPGSRIEYQLMVAGDADSIKKFKQRIQSQLTPAQKILDTDNNQPALFETLKRADNYLALASMLCIILAGIAITNAAYRYSERHYNHTALLRCLGLTRAQLAKLISLQLIIIGAISSAAGCLLGYGGQALLTIIFSPWVKLTLPPPDFYPVITGFFTGFLLLVGFALPRFLRLINVVPLQVLRKELPGAANNVLVIYGLAIIAITGLLLWQTSNLLLTIILLYGLGFAAAALYLIARLLIKASHLFKNQTSITWRYGIANLSRRAQSSTVQLIAFGLIVMVSLLLFILREDLLNTWRAQIPVDAPNYFVINMQPDEIDAVNKFFTEHHIDHSYIFPVVRGRLTQLNGMPVKQAVPDNARNNNALNRELSLTWSAQLPRLNKIISGQWWQTHNNSVVSIENDLAKKLGIKLGDKLTFQIGDQLLTSEVINTRSVEWTSFQPNFFMIFPPGTLNNFPTTYMSSFYLPPVNRTALAKLVKQFPSVTIIDVAELITQVQAIIDRISLAVTYLMFFTLLASLLVLFAAIQATLPERHYEAALLRTLGASRYQINSSIMAEFACLGLLAGLLGAVAATLIAVLLANKVFSLHYTINYQLCLLGIIISAVATMAAGVISTREVLRQSPLKTLRKLF